MRKHPTLSLSLFYALCVVVALAGCDKSTPQPQQPSAQNTFGHRQLEQMLDDRPDMRGVLPASHPATKWIIDSFNGDRVGGRIYWNAGSPQSGRSAEHATAYEGYPPYIAISGGMETTAIDKWASVIFELYNLENTHEFQKVFDDATKGLVDGDTYAEKCVELEFVALKKTREYFQANPLPKSSHHGDIWYDWVTTSLPTFEDYKKSFDVPGVTSSNSNFAYFKEYYDSVISPYGAIIQKTKNK